MIHLNYNDPVFYVYFYINSLDGKEFYIGMGSDDRYLQHVKDAARFDTSSYGVYKTPRRVVSMIRSIWQQGGKIIIRKTSKDLCLQPAKDLERELIRRYGKHLVNLQYVTIVDELLKVPIITYRRPSSV